MIPLPTILIAGMVNRPPKKENYTAVISYIRVFNIKLAYWLKYE